MPYKCLSEQSGEDFNPNARIHQITKLMLFVPSSGMVSCPLAMTDGAAFTLTQLKKEGKYWDKDLEEALSRLTSD